ncbi:membrane protein [Purpureocillium lavendulum]|uniref:Membrane protein n=1 Tax=Purpureocillium lavendulum TaxID=1247861 RepID=A0AB34FFV6_9HYPO|nr:membrane protein [Purpureocillium lavendulum]
MSLLHALLRITAFRSPLLRAVVPCAAAAVVLQAAAAAPSILARSERFYDVSGSATFLAVGALSLYLPALRARAAGRIPALPSLLDALLLPAGRTGPGAAWWNWRQVVATGLAMLWTIRLGSYLFKRVVSTGHDSRFDGIRDRPAAFAGAFLAQAAWVTLMLAPVMALNAVAPAAAIAAGAAGAGAGTTAAAAAGTAAGTAAGGAAAASLVRVTDVLGLGLWVLGFGFEAVADAQKSRWLRDKKDKKHEEAFMTSGLFSKSRFPHYFGEITLWTGLATFAAGAVATRPAQAALGLGGGPAGVLATSALCFVAPAFSAFLLTRVSGIPMSEGKYDERYGHRADYQAWKRDVPRLVPKLW